MFAPAVTGFAGHPGVFKPLSKTALSAETQSDSTKPAKGLVLPGEVRREPLLTRREFVRNTVRLAVVGAVLPGALSQILPSIAPSNLSGGGAGPVIVRDPKTNDKFPVKVGDLKPQPSNPPLVGEWNFLPATIYMVRTDVLKASSNVRGYNTAQYAVEHPTQDGYSILVYRAKCKHLGCTVGWNGLLGASKDIEDYNGDGVNDGRILCPCHQGQYDIHDLAKNVPGTPPPQPLNVIEFDVVDFAGSEQTRMPATPKAIVGQALYEQLDYKGAHGRGQYPAKDATGAPWKLTNFAQRKAGWSL